MSSSVNHSSVSDIISREGPTNCKSINQFKAIRISPDIAAIKICKIFILKVT